MSAVFQLDLFQERRPTLPVSIGCAAVKAIESDHILTPAKGRMSWCDYTLNAYRGCSFGCAYCYAPFFVPDASQRREWGLWVEAKVRAVESLRKHNLRGKRIFMSSVTDPYQPLEVKLGLTRNVVETLMQQGAKLTVQTRSPIVLRDADLLRGSRVNLSITCDTERVRKRYEPLNTSIDRRLETVRKLKEQGIRTGISICPMLPMEDPERFAKRILEIGPESVMACWFHRTERPFASDTRVQALEISKELGWTYLDYKRAFDTMKRFLPQLHAL